MEWLQGNFPPIIRARGIISYNVCYFLISIFHLISRYSIQFLDSHFLILELISFLNFSRSQKDNQELENALKSLLKFDIYSEKVKFTT